MGATMVKNGNLLDALPQGSGTLHIVMLGLDSAGKTTALYRLKFDQYLNTVPTIGFNCEKVHGTLGKAKGIHFLVWDVGGQEKLRPLWRSYTRCTDGILFVVDSVDVERMEEAKMELMRTAKCPDNQGVPVLILANKQDLPDACSPNELEKLLGLHELQNPLSNFSTATSMSTSNIAAFNANNQTHISREPNVINQLRSPIAPPVGKFTSNSNSKVKLSNMPDDELDSNIPSNAPITPNALSENSSQFTLCSSSSSGSVQLKGWFIQPACAITGEGLQEGLDALYDMILKRRKLSKVNKKNKR